MAGKTPGKFSKVWKIALVAVLLPWAAQADVTSLFVSRDTTIYNDPSATPLGNGAGTRLYAGVTGPNNSEGVRRSLLAFDLSMLPATVVITSATLRLTVDREPGGAGPASFALHRAAAEWGEGASNAGLPGGAGASATAGDATWDHGLYDAVLWSAPGGDFQTSASVTFTLDGPNAYFIEGAGLVADIQFWADNPAQSFGWFLLGDESGSRNARRILSLDSADEDAMPQLTVGYTVIPEPAVTGLWMAAGWILTLYARTGRRSHV